MMLKQLYKKKSLPKLQFPIILGTHPVKIPDEAVLRICSSIAEMMDSIVSGFPPFMFPAYLFIMKSCVFPHLVTSASLVEKLSH